MSTDQYATSHAEVQAHVNAIRHAEKELTIVDEYRACGDEAAAKASATAALRDWKGDKCWIKIGWAPDGQIRGGYWVELTEAGFKVHGLIDLDGDGNFAEYVATEAEEAKRVSPEAVN